MSSDSALLKALKSGDEKGVVAALKDGATAHRKVRGDLSHVYHDDVPLMALAAWTGIPNIVKALLDAGAHLDSECVDWQTPPGSDDDLPFYGPSALGVACGNSFKTIQKVITISKIHTKKTESFMGNDISSSLPSSLYEVLSGLGSGSTESVASW